MDVYLDCIVFELWEFFFWKEVFKSMFYVVIMVFKICFWINYSIWLINWDINYDSIFCFVFGVFNLCFYKVVKVKVNC